MGCRMFRNQLADLPVGSLFTMRFPEHIAEIYEVRKVAQNVWEFSRTGFSATFNLNQVIAWLHVGATISNVVSSA